MSSVNNTELCQACHTERTRLTNPIRSGCREHTSDPSLLSTAHFAVYGKEMFFSLKSSWNLLHTEMFFRTCTSLLFSHHVKASEGWSTLRSSTEKKKKTSAEMCVYYSTLLLTFFKEKIGREK